MHVTASFACRFELAKASRVWRQGVPTALVMDQSLHMLQDAAEVQVVLYFTAPVWIASLQLCGRPMFLSR